MQKLLFVLWLFYLCPVFAAWNPTDVSGAPNPRKLHTALWTGKQMLVWGGIDSPNNWEVFDGGGLYDPMQNTWKKMDLGNENQRRFGHSAVWTGKQMLAWGGAVAMPINSGVAFNPRTNRWRSLPLTLAPSARYLHRSVWTGKEMLIWGGQNLNIALADGGGYDPHKNRWTVIGSNPEIKGRYGHSMAWTGTEMLVFGGNPSPDGTRPPLADGAAYNPKTKTWRKISGEGAPIGRVYHSGIWTGSKWIVWGGLIHDGISPRATNDGAIYDPATDLWTEMPSDKAPSPRFFHTAVWTGTKMVVFGGIEHNDGLNNGGIFDPATNSWQTLPGGTLPGGRFQHTAVWTGSQMIVWGGNTQISLTEPTLGERNDGGVLTISEESLLKSE